MGHQHLDDLDMEDMNFGTIRRSRSAKNKNVVKKNQARASVQAKQCLDCGKLGYRTEEEARQAISRLLESGKLIEERAFVIHPYLCHHGWWHWGRDYKVLVRLKKAGKTAPVAQENTKPAA